MKNTERSSLTDEFQHEQHTTHQKIDEWREWWNELSEFGQQRFGEMHDRLQLIRDHLDAHFRHEEQSGFFQQLAERQPEYAQQCEHLASDHRMFLDKLDHLCEKLGVAEPQFESWGKACQTFEELLGELEVHEKEELLLFEAWKNTEKS